MSCDRTQQELRGLVVEAIDFAEGLVTGAPQKERAVSGWLLRARDTVARSVPSRVECGGAPTPSDPPLNTEPNAGPQGRDSGPACSSEGDGS